LEEIWIADYPGNQQTATLVADIDKDGIDDFIITERTESPSVVWYRRTGNSWDKYAIDKDKLRIEAGSASFDIDNDGGEKVVSEIIKNGGKALFISCDLRKEDDIVAMVEDVMKHFNRIDILVNNAGLAVVALTWELPTEAWDNIMAVNNPREGLRTNYEYFFCITGFYIVISDNHSMQPPRTTEGDIIGDGIRIFYFELMLHPAGYSRT